MNSISNNSDWQNSAPNSRRATSLPWKTALAALVAVVALGVLSGCASARGSSSDFDPAAYNPNTGYPAIGGGVPWHM